MRLFENVLVTGGAGFIGSNFIRYLLRRNEFSGRIVNVDSLTYAGNPLNLTNVEKRHGARRYSFVRADIRDYERIREVFSEYDIDCVVHFAAESHVDRSIFGPRDFIETNVTGTFNLLEAAREQWHERENVLFHHVSTDEVYGSLGKSGRFSENTRYDPRSPYSASKASSDHLVRSYFHTYRLPCTLSNCSNNYGPYQFPEKLVPLMILNMTENKPLPVYGDGANVRDWLYVEDHCSAVWRILQRGEVGKTYNVGGENEWKNIALVELLCERVAVAQGKEKDRYKKLITFVKDRPGHDRRYAIDCERIKVELGWRQEIGFEKGIDETVRWYLDNGEWIDRIRSGEYRKWIERNYENRSQ
jgi:dTDP-glucose 4,6-dehydratase